jgi:hypothetical protein
MDNAARARNETFFREVNDQIEAVSQTIPETEPTMEFLCECDDLGCQAKVEATRAEYEALRAEPTHFVVLPDHVDPEVEHVVFTNERFLVVEKEGAPAKEAAESDPRG